VWGCMLYPKYIRDCEFVFGGRTLTPPLTLEFVTTFKNKWVPSSTTAKIYNPSPETIAACEKTGSTFPEISIMAGYKKDMGVATLGEITAFKITDKGVDRILDLTIGDKTDKWVNSQVARTFPGGVTATLVATALISEAGLIPANIRPQVNKTYSRGISFNTTFRKALKQIADDTESELFLRNGQVAFQEPATAGLFAPVILDPDEIIKLDKTDKGYKCKTYYNYKIQAGSPVFVTQAEGFTGTIKASTGKSTFSTTGKTFTEFEGVVIG